jgi:hypothetical protein
MLLFATAAPLTQHRAQQIDALVSLALVLVQSLWLVNRDPSDAVPDSDKTVPYFLCSCAVLDRMMAEPMGG